MFSCFVCLAFYFVYSVFLCCFVYLSPYVFSFVFIFICVQVYGPLSPSDNPIAVNKYHIISYAWLLNYLALHPRTLPVILLLQTELQIL
jgi:hypothetical protein